MSPVFPARPLTREALQWRGLRLFSLYRIIVAGLFSVLEWAAPELQLFELTLPSLYRETLLGWLGAALALSLMATFHWPAFRIQLLLQAVADLCLLILLMHATGGVPGGLGTLLIVSVGGISLLAPGRLALLHAAVASLALLVDLIVGYWHGHYPALAFTQTGILGATLFLTALLASRLAHAAARSEALAQERGRQLADLAEINAQIIERMQSGVLVMDGSGQLRHANRKALSLLGATDTDGLRLNLAAPALFEAWREWDKGRGEQRATLVLGQPGTEVTVRFRRGGPGEHQGSLVFLDETEESRRMAQEIKLASLGRLTASIAHEIRNPLGAISHAAQLLEESPDLSEPDRRLARIITEQSRRMNTVIQNILRLSRSSAAQPERIALLPWLQDFIEEFARHHGKDSTRIELLVDPEDTHVRFDSEQLHQILWNLCSNACQHACHPDRESCIRLQGGQDENDRPWLDVIDNGPGIPPEVQEHLFEPFFTTRSGGVGLGLYIAREMCKNNLAELEYIPMPMGGSCFRILFPPMAGDEP